MSEEQGHSQAHDEQKRVQRTEHTAAPSVAGIEGMFVPAAMPTYSDSLLGDPRLSGRGNQPVRVAVMRRMQRSHGNRAVQRFLQRQQTGSSEQSSSAPLASLSVQRSSEPPVAVQRIDDDNNGGARLDELRAQLIEQLDGNPQHTDTLLLLQRASDLHRQFQNPPGPRTQAAAARALIAIWRVLSAREQAAQRANDGALLRVDMFTQELVPWTDRRPHRLGQIEPFTAHNVGTWEQSSVGAALERAPAGQPGRASASSSSSSSSPSPAAPTTPAPATATPTPPSNQPAQTPAAGTPAAGTPAAGQAQAGPSMDVGSGGVTEQQQTATERWAGGTGGARDIANGMRVLRGHNLGQAVHAVADALNQGNSSDPTWHGANVTAPPNAGMSLANLTQEVYYVANQLYIVDRTGHIVPGTFRYEISVSSLGPGTYFFGTFRVSSPVSGNTNRNLMIRLDGGPHVVSGDIQGRSVTQDHLPLMSRAQGVINAHHGIAIIVSPNIARTRRQHGFSGRNLWRALRGVPAQIPWAIRSGVAHLIDNPTDAIIAQLQSEALAAAGRAIASAAGPIGIVMMMHRGWEYGNNLSIASGEHSTDDEVNIASQAVARQIVAEAVGRLVDRGIARVRGRLGRQTGGADPHAQGPHEEAPAAGGGAQPPHGQQGIAPAATPGRTPPAPHDGVAAAGAGGVPPIPHGGVAAPAAAGRPPARPSSGDDIGTAPTLVPQPGTEITLVPGRRGGGAGGGGSGGGSGRPPGGGPGRPSLRHLDNEQLARLNQQGYGLPTPHSIYTQHDRGGYEAAFRNAGGHGQPPPGFIDRNGHTHIWGPAMEGAARPGGGGGGGGGGGPVDPMGRTMPADPSGAGVAPSAAAPPPVRNPVVQMPAVNPADVAGGAQPPAGWQAGPVGSGGQMPVRNPVVGMSAVNPADAQVGAPQPVGFTQGSASAASASAPSTGSTRPTLPGVGAPPSTPTLTGMGPTPSAPSTSSTSPAPASRPHGERNAIPPAGGELPPGTSDRRAPTPAPRPASPGEGPAPVGPPQSAEDFLNLRSRVSNVQVVPLTPQAAGEMPDASSAGRFGIVRASRRAYGSEWASSHQGLEDYGPPPPNGFIDYHRRVIVIPR